ncbi:MAG: hypothetical protein ACE5J2_04210 [Nitrososphaerales archaeon]
MKSKARNMLVISLFSTFAFSLYVTELNTYAQEPPPPLTVAPFKGVYGIGMTVILFGDVTGSFTPGSDVEITVTNPDGQSYQNANAKLDETGSYSYEFTLEGSQATVLGVHTVETRYQGLKATTSFEVRQKAVLTISVEKNTFDLGDQVTIIGTVTPRLIDPVEVKIYNPNGAVWKFIAVSADKIRADGTFIGEAGELSGKLSIPGKYKVEAEYADGTATAMLEFNVVASGTVTPGRFLLVDQSGKGLEDIFVGQQVLVQADIRNNAQEKQPFTYFVLINDADRITISLSWITGTLPVAETLSAAQSWIPDEPGSYTVKIFVWESVSNPSPLGKSLEMTVTVTE